MGTILKTFTLKGKQIEQVYYGGQDIRYRVDGQELGHDKFWKSPFVIIHYAELINQLNN